MRVDLSVLEGNYLGDLLAQPHAIADTIAALRSCIPLPTAALSTASRVVLTGMGSSLHATHPLQIRLAKAGRAAVVLETAELVYSQPELLDERTLVVAISQSGRSAETVQLLDRIAAKAKRPFVVGVTNVADSPLATRADLVVPLVAGAEFSVSCKTYLATLAALEWLGAALCGDDVGAALDELKEAPRLVAAFLDDRDAHVRDLVARLRDVRHLFLVGRGASLSSAGTGALILKESTRFHAEGMSAPSFRHGPLEMVTAKLFAVVFAGAASTRGLNEGLARDIVAAGGQAAIVGEHASDAVFRLAATPERVRPILEMLPVQMMSLALAAIAGREPGVFERATKVTVTE